MNRWDDTTDFRHSGHDSGPAGTYAGRGRDFFGRACGGQQRLDRWVERTRSYLKRRTADHWIMFAAGLLLGALLG